MSHLSELLAARMLDARYDEELWRVDYQRNPYLKNLLQAELDARKLALDRNLEFLLNPARDAAPEWCSFLSSWWWLKKRLQTLAEYELRKLSPPTSDVQIPMAKMPPFTPRHPNGCNFVVRYGERVWLEPMFEEGRVRLAPASSYRDQETNTARQDNELEKPHHSLGDGVRITDMMGRIIPIIGDVQYVRPAIANYYILCAANEFDERLFSLFSNSIGQPADASIVIWDMDTFSTRLEQATQQVLRGWHFHHNPVQYFDPRCIEARQHVDAGMSKDFAFAHQREYRFLWTPPQGREARTHIEVKLGPLSDIAGIFGADGKCLAGRSKV